MGLHEAGLDRLIRAGHELLGLQTYFTVGPKEARAWTIAKGTLPLAFFGPAGYGERQGLMMAPARVAQAFAPLLFGLLIDGVGAAALWVTSLLGVAALAALWMLRPVARQ